MFDFEGPFSKAALDGCWMFRTLSTLSEDTFVYNISSNEISTENRPFSHCFFACVYRSCGAVPIIGETIRPAKSHAIRV